MRYLIIVAALALSGCGYLAEGAEWANSGETMPPFLAWLVLLFFGLWVILPIALIAIGIVNVLFGLLDIAIEELTAFWKALIADWRDRG